MPDIMNKKDLKKTLIDLKEDFYAGIITCDKKIKYGKIIMKNNDFLFKQIFINDNNMIIKNESIINILKLDILSLFPSFLSLYTKFNTQENNKISIYSYGSSFYFNKNLLKNKPLYIDWDWLYRISGGINSLGLGIVISGSVGWEKSLFKIFIEKMNNLNTLQLAEINSYSKSDEFCIITPNINICYDDSQNNLFMEGHEWIKGYCNLGNDIIPLFFKINDTFLYPIEMIGKIPVKFKIWAEKLPTTNEIIINEIKKNYFIKIRGIIIH